MNKLKFFYDNGKEYTARNVVEWDIFDDHIAYMMEKSHTGTKHMEETKVSFVAVNIEDVLAVIEIDQDGVQTLYKLRQDAVAEISVRKRRKSHPRLQKLQDSIKEVKPRGRAK